MRDRYAAVVLCGLLLFGCGGSGDDVDPTREIKPRAAGLSAFGSCAELESYLIERATDEFVAPWTVQFGGGGGAAVDFGGAAGAAEDANTPPASPPTDFTTTNIQELGVDEPDLVKTDGQTYFYVQDDLRSGNSTLFVIDAWPPEQAQELARVPVRGFHGALFLAGDVVVVLTAVGGGPGGVPGPVPVPLTDDSTAVRVTLVDVSTPDAPSVRRTYDIEGYRVGARFVDGQVYVATQHTPTLYDPALINALDALGLPDPWSLSDADRAARAPQIREQVEPLVADYVRRTGRARLLPDLRIDDGPSNELLACTQIMRPAGPCQLALLSVVAFDPTTDLPPTGAGIVANGFQVYGSQDSLYVVQDSRWWWWPADEMPHTETHIHQFELNSGAPTYAASGKVDGWLLNQFSMSEHEGFLRVATTDQTFGGGWWGPGLGGPVAPGVPITPGGPDVALPLTTLAPPVQANNVFVLSRNGGALDVVGELRGLGPNERIFSARFMGDTGYLVTFRQTDPLFVIDLSDPRAPSLQGELHITGFSTYLHPFGADHLIGIGREATETGRVLGLQLQLFDVSDPTNPTRTHQRILGTNSAWSTSEAEHDHHAFTFYASQDLLAIPVTLEDTSFVRDDYRHFSGIIVFRVSTDRGFEEIGRISHTDLVHQERCSPTERLDPNVDAACDAFAYPWYAHMRRAAFIGDYLYAFSNVGVTASHRDTIDTPAAVIPLR